MIFCFRSVACWLALLLVALPSAPVLALDSGIPSLADFEQRLQTMEHQEPADQQALEELALAIEFREEIDANLARIAELQEEARSNPAIMARLDRELAQARTQSSQDWQQQFDGQSLDTLVATLMSELEALESNQSELARTNTVLTRAQTLPEEHRAPARRGGWVGDARGRGADVCPAARAECIARASSRCG